MYVREIHIKSFRHLVEVHLGPFVLPPNGSDLVVLAGLMAEERVRSWNFWATRYRILGVSRGNSTGHFLPTLLRWHLQLLRKSGL